MNPPRSAPAHRIIVAAAPQEKIGHQPVKNVPRIVAVIADRAGLAEAMELREPPDFFELRLDALRDCLDEIDAALPRLHAPLILTARHPAEGGRGALAVTARRRLLRRFSCRAAFLDIELRSVRPMQRLIAEARRRQTGLIISVHDLRGTPPAARLRVQFQRALAWRPDIFKIATRTGTMAQLERLLAFFADNVPALPIAAMGIGKFGAESRRRFARLGSALAYGALGRPTAPGQPSLSELRRDRRAYII